MSPGHPRRVAPWLVLCLTVPLVAGTAPGSFQSENSQGCSEVPCLLWVGRHDGPEGHAAAHHVVLSPDGATAFVVGGTSTVDTSTDLVTWALDVATGELLWSQVYDGGADEDEWWYYDVRAITVSPDGSRVAVAGTSQGAFGMGHDIVTIVYDASTGAELWTDRHHDDEDDATAIAIDRTGTYVVTAGGVDHSNGNRDGVLLGYELATGDRLWELPFSSPCWISSIVGLQASPASSAMFVGGLRSTCLSDTAATSHDEALAFTPTIWAIDPATGAVLWEAQDDDPLLTMQSAVLVGSLEATAESVVLSSRITNPRNPSAALGGDLDVLTMAVDLEGESLWRHRYDSLGSDNLLGMSAAPDGSRVYVVATSPALTAAGVQDQNQDVILTALDGRTGAVAWTTRLDSSTTGATFDGRSLGGEGDDDAFLSVPALFDGGARLAVGYTAWIESPVPFVGPAGPNGHILSVLDTSDGSVVALRMDGADLEEYSYGALYDRADLVGVGLVNEEALGATASFRRLSVDVTPPDLDLPGDIVREALAPDGATVFYQAKATDDRDGDVAVTCSSPSGSTFPLGSTMVSCSASDSYGNVATERFLVQVLDTTPPDLHLPDAVAASATSTQGAIVHYTASAQDLVDADVAVSCSHASGATYRPGVTEVRCDAADAAGNTASAAFDVVVTYEWTGFQDPARADGSSTFQHGRTVPVKLQLAGASADIQDAAFRLFVQRAGGVEVPAMGRATSGNTLEYDEETATYEFQWNTGTVLPGEHRLRLDLGDGTWNVVTVRVT